MELRKPDFYDTFHCIAACCPDSCCKEWDVAVDEEKAALYRALPGALGENLREFLQDEDGDTYLTLDNGRCPMWRADGLCRARTHAVRSLAHGAGYERGERRAYDTH